MTMRKRTSLLALTMALMVAAPVAFAQGSDMNAGDSVQNSGEVSRPGPRKRFKGERMRRGKQGQNLRAFKQLSGLTADQNTKIDSIQTELKSNSESIVSQMKTLKEQLQGKRKEAWDKAFAVLTDEQKAELNTLMQNRQAGQGNGMRKNRLNKGERKNRRKALKGQNNLESVSNSMAGDSTSTDQ